MSIEPKTLALRFFSAAMFLLCVLALAGVFLYVFLNMAQELHDPDIWLHLKSGQYIIENKAVPKADIFSVALEGKDWIDHSWLTQVAYYLIFRSGGADALLIFSAWVMAGAFLVLSLAILPGRGHLALSTCIVAASIFACSLRLNLRPENISILFFALYLLIITRGLGTRWAYLLIPLQVLWVNMHGFFILGPLLLGLYLAADYLLRLKPLAKLLKAPPLQRHQLRSMLVIFPLVVAASLLNPYGHKGALYPLGIIHQSLISSKSFLYLYITELEPVSLLFNSGYPVFAYYLLLALTSVLVAVRFLRLHLFYPACWLALAAGSLAVNRNMAYFSLFSAVVLGMAVFGLIQEYKVKRALYQGAAAVILALVLHISWSADIQMLSASYRSAQDNRLKGALLGVNPRFYPVKAADFLAKNALPANIFNLFDHGAYLIYRLYPKYKVFIDGRTELYGQELFCESLKMLYGNQESIERLCSEYRINTVLVSDVSASYRDCFKYFLTSSEWALVYLDWDGLIFVRRKAMDKKKLASLVMDPAKRRTPRANLPGFSGNRAYAEQYLLRGQLLYSLGFYDQALSEVAEALRIFPRQAFAYIIMAKVHLARGLLQQAYEDIRRASACSPQDRSVFILLAEYYAARGDSQAAIKIYRGLLKRRPRLSRDYYRLGREYARIKEYAQASEVLRKAVALHPLQAAYYKELGQALAADDRAQEAIKLYEEAVVLGLDAHFFRRKIIDLIDARQGLGYN